MTESGRTLGPYQLEDSLGGTRTVFRARHVVSGEVVCVKLLPEHLRLDAISRGRRKRELLATKHVRHAGVGRPVDFVDADGRLFLVMEYIEAAPLSLALFGEVTLPVSRALRVVRGACEAVAAAHASHATHGCLEPDKVLVGQDGLIHAVGFGFRDEDALKNPGGDPPADVDLCTAPERWSGAFETTDADVWALGALLYRCLSGEYPFQAPTRLELSHKVQTSDVIPPKFEAGVVVKPAIEAVVLRALSRDPTLRYPDAAVFARALVELEGMMPEESAATPAVAAAPVSASDDVVDDAFADPPAPPDEDPALAAFDAAFLADDSQAAPLHDPFADGLPAVSEEGAPIVDDSFELSGEPVPAPPDELDIAADAEDALRAFEEAVGGGQSSELGADPFATLPVDDAAVVVDASTAEPPPAPVVEQPVEQAVVQAVAPLVPPAEASGVLEAAATPALPLPANDDDEPETSANAPAPRAPPVLLEDRPVSVARPVDAAAQPPKRGGRALFVAAAAIAAVAVFVVVDPLAMRGEPGATALATGAAGSPDDGAPAKDPIQPVDDTKAPHDPVKPQAAADAGRALATGPAAEEDAGAASASPEGDDEAVVAADGEAAAGDDDSDDDDDGAVAAADGSPEEAYEDAEKRLDEAIEERALLWKDDRALDKLRLKSKRQARLKYYAAATKTAEEALAAVAAVEIDAGLVKRKLLRYVKRRKELGDDDAAKRALSIEYRARKHLKDGEHEDANKLLNQGLRVMYRPGDDG